MDVKKVHVLRIHLGLFFAEVICLSAFTLELSRALRGNTLSWAYVVEWPVLGTYAVYMWRKLLNEERADDSTPTAHDAPEGGTGDPVEDPRLTAWNDYLTRVHAQENRRPKKS